MPAISTSESRHFLVVRSGALDVQDPWATVATVKNQWLLCGGILFLVNFLDHLVHNQDMRRPTGHSRQVPEERLRRALELVRTEGTPMFSPKKNVAGLKLVATDIDWSGGDGPGIEGAAEALVLAASGRMAALADLSGEGVKTLSGRLA
jgi:hypothetical protein